MTFTPEQIAGLSAKLKLKHVRLRRQGAATLPYVEGWHAISEANRIFGFDGWDRETLEMSCLLQRSQHGRSHCLYSVKVRITVHAGARQICREGHGTGTGDATDPAEAHDMALKAAETDATKRALITFGNPYGLALYDPARRGLAGHLAGEEPRPLLWPFISADGMGRFEDPARFCSRFREAIEAVGDAGEIDQLLAQNQHVLTRLRLLAPSLTDSQSRHYVDRLLQLAAEHRNRLAQHRAAIPTDAPPPPATCRPDDG